LKKLLLAGGGHSHIQVMKRLKKEPIGEVEITLISPSKNQYHPELIPGYIEENYKENEIRVNLERAAREAGVTWKEGAVLSIDPVQKLALTANGDILNFDLISIDIGSMTSGTDKISLTDDIYTIKPTYQFTSAIDAVRRADNLVIAGENGAAVEIASTFQTWRAKHNLHNPITLIAQNRLLPDMGTIVSKKIADILMDRGIRLYLSDDIQKIKGNKVYLDSQEIPFEKLLWVQPPKAPDLFKLSRLPVDVNGYLSIEETLQVKKYPFIFGSGECAVIEGQMPYSHSICTSIKQGNILYTNIKGYLDTGEGAFYSGGNPIYSPLDLGNKQGFAVYNNRPFHGRIPWVLRQLENKKLLKN
jgi:NADH dehydrogenase FAD-containing subunit